MFFSKVYCSRLLSNGEKVHRDWLLYSKSANKVYCFACKLFGGDKVVDKCLVVGYSNWQCLFKTLQNHEISRSHINAYLMWKELAARLSSGKTIDNDIQRALDREKAHWRGVLTRVVD